MNAHDTIKHFILNNLAIRADIKAVEQRFDLSLENDVQRSNREEQYYPQFTDKLRREAEAMADRYKIFYCLENFLRELIVSKLLDEQGEKWWDVAVPEPVRRNASDNRKKEITSGNTPRSDSLIDYTNFGELGEIIKANWTVFGDIFRDIRAIENIMSRLNTLRAPIAHCKVLAEDEVVRLHLSFRDLFRQMGS
jgi:HEPN superfamily Swt1-like protein